MAKYINKLIINKLDSGKRYYETLIPETPTVSENPTTYEARVGDRWDTVAYKFFGSARFWYAIAIANNAVDGSMFIKPGTVVKIPEV